MFDKKKKEEVARLIIQVFHNHLRLKKQALTCDSSYFTGHLVDMDNSYGYQKLPWVQ